jgi:hypothetical protein
MDNQRVIQSMATILLFNPANQGCCEYSKQRQTFGSTSRVFRALLPFLQLSMYQRSNYSMLKCVNFGLSMYHFANARLYQCKLVPACWVTQNKVNIIMDVLLSTSHYLLLDPALVIKNGPDLQYWFRGLILKIDIKKHCYKKYINILIIDLTKH